MGKLSGVAKKRKRGEEEDQEEEEEGVVMKPRRVKYVNKQRVLLVGSRGITARQRHLMEDIGKLLPHHKPEAKFDSKGEPRQLNEICDLKSCTGCLYLESRKRTRLYAWFARSPAGPTVKFRVVNVHTMDELRLTGNCALGTRPLLCFDGTFDTKPHWKVCRELLSLTFGSPRGHPKSKPFFDHALTFSIIDDSIWVRHYQITTTTDDAKAAAKKKKLEKVLGRGDDDAQELEREQAAAAAAAEDDDTKLVEIGPRFVLAPVRILAGSFRGTTIFNDPLHADDDWADGAGQARARSSGQAPRGGQQNKMRTSSKNKNTKKNNASKYEARVRAKAQRQEHKAALALA
mmetsp:Transcript_16585/g.54009  ORF Transcript_16585/g.54009 Transcript_16585/m.54009 type:complete len:346 (-) Transcript_16585:241-1278(-)